jgi:hypothetical protein
VVGDWYYWTTCTKGCGGGTQDRYRNIITQPQNGGKACPELKQTQSCNTFACWGGGFGETEGSGA